jgi:hypothetical protein
MFTPFSLSEKTARTGGNGGAAIKINDVKK